MPNPRRKILICGGVLALWVWGFPAPVLGEDVSDGAREFIESLVDKATSALAVDGVSRPERVDRFHILLNDHFAVKTIGQNALGRYWRKATEAERREYLQLFEDLIVETYVDRFIKYTGEDVLSVVKTVSKGPRDIVVYSQIKILEGASPVLVNWRVRAKSGAYKIVDVMVEGISLGLTQRSEFASVIRKSGGKIEGLLEELRRKLESGG